MRTYHELSPAYPEPEPHEALRRVGRLNLFSTDAESGRRQESACLADPRAQVGRNKGLLGRVGICDVV